MWGCKLIHSSGIHAHSSYPLLFSCNDGVNPTTKTISQAPLEVLYQSTAALGTKVLTHDLQGEYLNLSSRCTISEPSVWNDHPLQKDFMPDCSALELVRMKAFDGQHVHEGLSCLLST